MSDAALELIGDLLHPDTGARLSARGALALYNNGHHGAAPYPASDYAGPLPGTLLAFHRVDARGARALENRSRAAAPGPAPAAACRVYRP